MGSHGQEILFPVVSICTDHCIERLKLSISSMTHNPVRNVVIEDIGRILASHRYVDFLLDVAEGDDLHIDLYIGMQFFEFPSQQAFPVTVIGRVITRYVPVASAYPEVDGDLGFLCLDAAPSNRGEQCRQE